MKATRSGWRAHHLDSAAVHSRDRRDVVRVLAGEDHAAVDDPGDDRRELARGHRDHRLVQQPQAFAESPEPDQDVALLVGGEGEQVRVAEALSDRGGLARGGGSRLPVAARLLLEHGRQQEVAALDPVLPLAVEQPLGAAQPATRPADLSMAGERDTDPEGAAEGGQLIARGEVGAMRALEQVAVLGLSADHVGAAGKQLEVVGRQRRFPVGLVRGPRRHPTTPLCE